MTVASKRALRPARRCLLMVVLAALSTAAFAGPASAASFVIGDGNATVGHSVTFWGAQWWQENTLSEAFAPPSFKGWANTPEGAPACGTPWTTDPGNSSQPPEAPLPEVIEVIVSSAISKSGPTISGNTKKVVRVRTEPGYAANPGHAGTGTVIGVVCPKGGPT